MSVFIVDPSVAIKWVVAEAGTHEALALFGNRLAAPTLWRAECANILWKKVKRGELQADEALIAGRLLANAAVEPCLPEPELAEILQFALAIDHPAYDCVYLAAAKSLNAPLVTADDRLLRVVEAARQNAGGAACALQGVSVLSLIKSPSVP